MEAGCREDDPAGDAGRGQDVGQPVQALQVADHAGPEEQAREHAAVGRPPLQLRVVRVLRLGSRRGEDRRGAFTKDGEGRPGRVDVLEGHARPRERGQLVIPLRAAEHHRLL